MHRATDTIALPPDAVGPRAAARRLCPRAARNSFRGLWCAGVAGVLTACSAQPLERAAQPPLTNAPVAYQIDTVAEGLSYPWSGAFLPNGDMLVSERDGRLRIIRNGVLDPRPIAGLPNDIYVERQGGLFDVLADPDFANNKTLFLSYAGGDERANRTTVIRARFDGQALSNVAVIFKATPDKAGPMHYGGRMLMLPDRTILLTVGEGYLQKEKAQDLSSDLGKIVRIRTDGTLPADNPFLTADRAPEPATGKARPEIWTSGHRNPQGLARDPASGRIFAHEHGPRGGDEVNVLVPGANYGWPLASYGVDYTGLKITEFTSREGTEQPVVVWVPSIAPAGMAYYAGAAFPQWSGDLFVATLSGMNVRRLDLKDGAIVGQQELFGEVGERMRDVIAGPDGALYLLTDSADGRVLRVRARTP
jgi:glucose/arabinose dehydrogenase